LTNGNPCWTYVVRHPLGDFAVFIWPHRRRKLVSFRGVDQWRGTAARPGAIAKTLSMDMRTDDRAWLDMKLSALQKAVGDDGFEMAMPPDGRKLRVPSLVSGFAELIRYRCDELGRVRRTAARRRRRWSMRSWGRKNPKPVRTARSRGRSTS
jgi:ribonucleoside-diphosphate reductase alpha chain